MSASVQTLAVRRPLAAGLFLAAAAGLSLPAVAADEYSFDLSHSSIGFAVSHFGFSQVRGRFAEFDGTLSLDEANIENSSISVSIATASIDTGWADRDDHLRSGDFFDVEAFPEATFVSTSVTQTGDDTLEVAGDFTLLGTTQPVPLAVTLNQLGPNPFNDEVTIAGFSASTTISRSDFGMDYGLAIPDDPSTGIGDMVTIVIEAEMQH